MTEYITQVLAPLTILAIGITFGFMIGMLYYYPEVVKLRAKVKAYINKTLNR